jgi:hypothetical protein
MQDNRTQSVANQLYNKAHVAQYKDKDLAAALALYQNILATHPDEKEAGYSRSQIKAIASDLVPKQELLDAQVKLALAHLPQQP